MTQPPYGLVTVEGFDSQPSLDTVADSLGVAVSQIDEQFGVLLIDPVKGMYCIQLKSQQGDMRGIDHSHGPWANPPIEPFD